MHPGIKPSTLITFLCDGIAAVGLNRHLHTAATCLGHDEMSAPLSHPLAGTGSKSQRLTKLLVQLQPLVAHSACCKRGFLAWLGLAFGLA